MSHKKKLEIMRAPLVSLLALFILASPLSLIAKKAWVHSGFEDFSRGRFENAGGNLYVNAKGVIEIINHYDVNHDGYVDIVLANSHDHVERGPTWVYTADKSPRENWKKHQMSADSGWMSRVIDVDGDGYNDLVTVNAHNGVTSELLSYIYWSGPDGMEASRTDLPTKGAYDVVAMDINRDGRLDLLIPSAWVDSHNPATPRPIHVYIQGEDRSFRDEGERYNIIATGALGIATGDLNNDGFLEIVLASYRVGGRGYLDTESLIYWGTKGGVNTEEPFILPTYGARQVMLEDLNSDGSKDIIFSSSGQVRIYWNSEGKFNPETPLIFKVKGLSTVFTTEAVRVDVSDVDADGTQDLLIATAEGVEIRSGDNVETVKALIDVKNARWVTAADLDGDSLPELIISKHFDGNDYKIQSPILWNSSDGYSVERASWVSTIGVVGNTVGDLDGDGRPEVIFNNFMNGHVYSVPSYIYLGNADADYGLDNRLEFPNDLSNMALVADLDLDGYPDLVFDKALEYTNPEGIRIYTSTPEGPNPDKFIDIPTGHIHHDLEVADFNRDGYLDLLAIFAVRKLTDDPDQSSIIFYGSANGYSNERIDRLKNFGYLGTIGDVNNDGYIDVLFHDKREFILIYLGAADGYSDRRTWKVPCHGLEDSGNPNLADLNDDGWLDLIVGILGHRLRHKDTIRVFYGSPHGYTPDNIQEYFAGYSAGLTGVADLNNDGNLDLLVTAYGTPTSRVSPAQLFWGDGSKLDFDNPVNFSAHASIDMMQIDLNRDGWIDIVWASHRGDIGHQVDSLIYWNSPTGFFTIEPTPLPGLGPHGMYAFDHGNAFTRKPEENYVSPPYELGKRKARRIHWESEETELLKIKFQLRGSKTEKSLGDAAWMGPDGEGSYYTYSGETIRGIPKHVQWLQYKATFISPYGCGSPKLKEVRIDI